MNNFYYVPAMFVMFVIRFLFMLPSNFAGRCRCTHQIGFLFPIFQRWFRHNCCSRDRNQQPHACCRLPYCKPCLCRRQMSVDVCVKWLVRSCSTLTRLSLPFCYELLVWKLHHQAPLEGLSNWRYSPKDRDQLWELWNLRSAAAMRRRCER